MDQLKPLLGRTLVLVAHPDDEIIGCGALLQRAREPMVIFATNGAPRDEYWWKAYGSRDAYAEIRKTEAAVAMRLAGVREIKHLHDYDAESFHDQELFHHLPEAVSLVSKIIGGFRPDALLTLAYEGGHQDHDACNFIAAMAARLCKLPAWEMPLYHRTADGHGAWQQFLTRDGDEITLIPSAREIEVKKEMIAVYKSQHLSLTQFRVQVEKFRCIPVYDYSQPPHSWKLNYEAWGWPVSGREVAAAFHQYLQNHYPTTLEEPETV